MLLRDPLSELPKAQRRAAIEFRRVSKVFISRSGKSIPVLRNASVSIDEGALTAIVGESGSGKSTSAHLAAGLDTEYQGIIRFFGIRVPCVEGPELCLHRASIGFVSQSFNLISALSAVQNVALALIARRTSSGQALRMAHQKLRSLGLDHRAHSRPDQLSGGERQRVAIARALAVGNRVIIADEPTGNLDLGNARLILKAFKAAVQEGQTVVIVTHSQRVAEGCDRVLRVESGRFTTALDDAANRMAMGPEEQRCRTGRRRSILG